MEYGFEAFFILIGVLFPLVCCVIFLYALVGSLGSSSTVDPLPEEIEKG
ncbi:hypothetical protein [Ectobacillus ponti]|uniref:Uncharacterized protein n=1 Tax=Ectobacillus ponti TaxID=2961894 RepID=A0AA41X8L7_9BACI|nr:hypothetical protein [Ectobacillus ponti]MCP8968885.1 hypothetical protein [Ectobacillus ponti]